MKKRSIERTIRNVMAIVFAIVLIIGAGVLLTGCGSKADNTAKVPAAPYFAKGVYYNYENYKFAFGCNKGDQIFEIRSYDENLNTINLEDIENYFGTPDYESKTTEGEKVVGYKVSGDYKLKFVFNEHSLDHYSVFYPEITANYMADDPGREW